MDLLELSLHLSELLAELPLAFAEPLQFIFFLGDPLLFSLFLLSGPLAPIDFFLESTQLLHL